MTNPDPYASGFNQLPTDSAPEPAAKAGRRKGPARTKRAVNRHIAVAVLFALVTAGVVFAMSGKKGPVDPYVVVASSAIPAGSTVDPGMLKAIRTPKASLSPGSVSGMNAKTALADAAKAVAGQRSQYPMTANQQLVPDQFGAPIGNLGAPLAADQRLVSFQATVSAAVAGSLKAGDIVDVYASANNLAGVLVRNVPIVSVTVSEAGYNSVTNAQSTDKNITPAEALPSTPVPGTYVARVSADDVAKIVAADADGKIYLAYRSADATDGTEKATSVLSVLCANEPETPLPECANYQSGQQPQQQQNAPAN